MLELKDIHWKIPGGDEIIKGIDLKLTSGKMTVVTGPNGCGKTSLAKLIAGLEVPTSGKILLDGEDITKEDITSRALHGISYAFQQPICFKSLTVKELLNLSAKRELSEDELARILNEVGLNSKEYCDRFVDRSLSGGESKRIEIASVLAKENSKVIIFDEPEAGIDLWSFNSLIEVFEKMKNAHNSALLVISHQERILEIADEIVVVEDGKVIDKEKKELVLQELLSDEQKGGLVNE